MLQRRMILARDTIERGQMQPASLDLRLGPKAYRVRASFLPGKSKTVAEQLQNLKFHEISLTGAGAVLERGCVYVIPLLESLVLPDSISAVANPKSSTGRSRYFHPPHNRSQRNFRSRRTRLQGTALCRSLAA
ncbi:MAG: 2'-deoxycytidine 5'-triphosphate deaminase [Methylovirgula sp.]